MGILDRLRRKKKKDKKLDEPMMPRSTPEIPYGARHTTPQKTQPVTTSPSSHSSLKAEMDLVLSQMHNLKMQYEAIDSRLRNIEKLVAEIRSFCD